MTGLSRSGLVIGVLLALAIIVLAVAAGRCLPPNRIQSVVVGAQIISSP